MYKGEYVFLGGQATINNLGELGLTFINYEINSQIARDLAVFYSKNNIGNNIAYMCMQFKTLINAQIHRERESNENRGIEGGPF